MIEFIIFPLAVIGLAFLIVFVRGLILNGVQSAISFDQWIGTCFISGHMADETISAWAHRGHHYRWERFINWLFSDDNHCAKAYISELNGSQNDPEYHRLLGN